MTTADRYRVLVDGRASPFGWDTMDGAVREATRASDEHPYAEIRIRKPDVIVQRARPREDGAA